MKIFLKKQLLYLLIAILPNLAMGQAESIFNGVKLDESQEIVETKLKAISGSTNMIHVENPSFPLAKDLESHLICGKVKTVNGTIDKVVFTFADNKLSYIEARGNAVTTLAGKRKDTARSYLDYDVYFPVKLFIHKKKDMAWIINKEALHVNLFTWENPYLDDDDSKTHKLNPSGKIPEFIKMGASLEELKPLFEANSKFTSTEDLDGSDPNAQLQINAFGVDYLGFPRKVEARFGNNKLNVVWILTGKGEENRIRKALIAIYGEAIFKNDDWEIFNNWQIGLRKDKPEILLLTQELGLIYKKEYFKQ
jgi:hypothetical protein